MKLIKKTQVYYLLLIAGLLLVWSVGFMLFMSAEINESTDEMLDSDLETLVTELKKEPSAVQHFPNSIIMQIKPIPTITNDGVSYKNVMLPDPEDGEMEEFRQVTTQTSINGQPYKVILRQSKVEYDHLWSSILIALLIFVVALIGFIALVNRRFLRQIWNPFYHTLGQLGNYSIQRKQQLTLKQTNIDEFQALNTEIKKLLSRIEDDYQQLKQFTENASHEIQTPLSVIQNQVELLFQDEDMPEGQQKRIGEINKMAGRLSRLNRTLLLLTKIENEQYVERRVIDITQLLTDFVAQYRKLAEAKNITVHDDLQKDVRVTMNPELAEMLFRNLLSNAIKHNHPDGTVNVVLKQKSFMIRNTGPAPDGDPSQWFGRFKKGESKHAESLGLGLSIVHTIVIANDFDIDYLFEEGRHIFKVVFS